MSETKHTPGPWKRSYRNITANGVIVARVLPAEGGPEQEAANARLIAAAPDLLAACEAVERWWNEHAIEGTPETDAFCTLARAAIAAAKGGAR
ncbi:MAG: hypothetical protein ACK52I_01800 [Pseudomonadota bacterium]|jgi:hypothetical protein